MFYIICPDDKLRKIVDYAQRELAIDANDVSVIEMGVKRDALVDKIKELEKDINSLPRNKFMVLVNHFENLVKSAPEDLRHGHDYDQDIFENPDLENLFKASSKKMIILTHIGHTAGEKIYEKAVAIAISSQFKSGIIEVK